MGNFRWRAARMLGVCAVALGAGAPGAGAAYADKTHQDSHRGSGFALVRTGQIDDPMEDVLEHALLLGDGYGRH